MFKWLKVQKSRQGHLLGFLCLVRVFVCFIDLLSFSVSYLRSQFTLLSLGNRIRFLGTISVVGDKEKRRRVRQRDVG